MTDWTNDGRIWRNILIGFFLIALAASILVPAFSKKTIVVGQPKEVANIEQVGFACKEYAIDHAGKFPPKLDDLYPQYLSNRSPLNSPEVPSQRANYDYTPGLTTSSPPGTVLIKLLYGKNEAEIHVDDSLHVTTGK
jgi:hypothetical protein